MCPIYAQRSGGGEKVGNTKKTLVLGVCGEKRTCCLRSSEVTNFWVALSIDWAWHGQALSHRHKVATPVPLHSRVSSANAVDIVKSTCTALHYRENEGNLSGHLELLWTCHRQSSDSIKEPSHRNTCQTHLLVTSSPLLKTRYWSKDNRWSSSRGSCQVKKNGWEWIDWGHPNQQFGLVYCQDLGFRYDGTRYGHPLVHWDCNNKVSQ